MGMAGMRADKRRKARKAWARFEDEMRRADSIPERVDHMATVWQLLWDGRIKVDKRGHLYPACAS